MAAGPTKTLEIGSRVTLTLRRNWVQVKSIKGIKYVWHQKVVQADKPEYNATSRICLLKLTSAGRMSVGKVSTRSWFCTVCYNLRWHLFGGSCDYDRRSSIVCCQDAKCLTRSFGFFELCYLINYETIYPYD